MEARAPLGAVPMPHDRMVSKDRFQELLYTVYIYMAGGFYPKNMLVISINCTFSMFCSTMFSIIWLVVSTPLKNISQVG